MAVVFPVEARAQTLHFHLQSLETAETAVKQHIATTTHTSDTHIVKHTPYQPVETKHTI